MTWCRIMWGGMGWHGMAVANINDCKGGKKNLSWTLVNKSSTKIAFTFDAQR